MPDGAADGGGAREEQPPRRARPLERARRHGERTRARTEQSFCVPKADIAAQGYDLSLNRYKEIVHDEIETGRRWRSSPTSSGSNEEIAKGTAELKGMLA